MEEEIITLYIAAWNWFLMSLGFLIAGMFMFFKVKWLAYVFIFFFAVTLLISLYRKWEIKKLLE